MIPIFTYHKITSKDNLMNRKPSSLLKDLDYLRNNKYYLLTVEELYKGYINAPLGYIPAVLSFDDSHISQFKYLSSNKIDPNSAIGILEDYKKKYPTFRITAIFFVTPCQRGQNELFGQKQWINKKLSFLLENSYEIGNHSCSHPNYQTTSIERIQSDLNLSQTKINTYLPNFQYTSLATPYGSYPKRKLWPLLAKSSSKKHSYRHKLIFSYSNRLSLSPFAKNYNLFRVSRLHGFEEALQSYRQKVSSGEWKPFISDGNPNLVTIPKSRKDELKIRSNKNLILAPNSKDYYPWKLY
ncbi:MAG: polysaccharide deacetylase family protein [Leptospira sp.]|nr:polysaccharide deacetylase family protein [Leptospira sp.]NCS93383.1 polysaccharide deacetylase family protein [Leptospira sp.]